MLKSVKSKLTGVGGRKKEGDSGRQASSQMASKKPSSSAGSFIPPMEMLYDKNKPLFLFRDVVASERRTCSSKKLQLCSYTFDFTDATAHVREKEIKRQTLLELVDYVNQGQGKFTEAVFEDISFMLAQNLFRGLPPSNYEITGSAAGDNFDPEEEEPTLEPSWPHLQIVYEFLLRYVVSNEVDAKVGKKYIDNSFVLKLLGSSTPRIHGKGLPEDHLASHLW